LNKADFIPLYATIDTNVRFLRKVHSLPTIYERAQISWDNCLAAGETDDFYFDVANLGQEAQFWQGDQS